MKVKLIDSMGDDIRVANAARVSFHKKSMPVPTGDGVSKKDKGLINYLAKHGHWTPFGHVYATLYVKAPIFVARQLVKHQVGLVWNEVSRRYVTEEPEFYFPDTWRGKPENAKQGSSDEVIESLVIDEFGHELEIDAMLKQNAQIVDRAYRALINNGVAPEQARMILPQNMYTEWYWSGSLIAFARICGLRCRPDTQKESQEIGWMINDAVKNIASNSWEALKTW